ncbi:MAG: DUF4178 domain-containing protein [Gemmatimonadaceae bacterium]|jgi:hypothetical protein|nr:DUF4178 domain-containing protein [Gemmatimonadaceae bacterium]
MATSVAPQPTPLVRSFTCPSCGGAIAQRTGGWAQTIVCPQCGAVLDADDASLRILQAAEQRERIRPLLPLGTRGTLSGVLYEVTGFQRRQIVVDGVAYHWNEYLLFNPWHGFRYLSEYGGHWNEIEVLKRQPVTRVTGGRPAAQLEGQLFKHFQTADAETVYVLGEFPWEIRYGDRAQTQDYISPPRLLSAELTGEEQTWSLGTYRTADEMRRAFPDVKGLPSPTGVFANQPSPYAGRAKRLWTTWVLLVLGLIGMLVVNQLFAARTLLLSERYVYDKAAFAGDSTVSGAFVTPVFTATGRPSNIEIAIESDVDQDWMYLNIALVDVARGSAREFGREISYYSGRDSDGSWSEGSRRDRVRIPAVPAGEYYLRVEPEGGDIGRIGGAPVQYSLTVRRDVPNMGFYAIAFLVLLLPPVFGGIASASFEGRRWAESDYASSSGSDDGE